MKQSICDLRDNTKKSNTLVIGILEKEGDREKGRKKYLKR